MSNSLEQLINEITEAQKRFLEEGKSAFKVATKEFFDANPEVRAIGWTQYAPYFNDGEPCEFSVHDIYATTLDPSDDDFSAYDLVRGEYSYGDEHEAKGAQVDEFLRLLSKVPDDLYRSLFGDDAMIVMTRTGIDIDEYDHD